MWYAYSCAWTSVLTSMALYSLSAMLHINIKLSTSFSKNALPFHDAPFCRRRQCRIISRNFALSMQVDMTHLFSCDVSCPATGWPVRETGKSYPDSECGYYIYTAYLWTLFSVKSHMINHISPFRRYYPQRFQCVLCINSDRCLLVLCIVNINHIFRKYVNVTSRYPPHHRKNPCASGMGSLPVAGGYIASLWFIIVYLKLYV